ncbi:MAG: MFS transporter [Gammaproteobacteria bacterium]|nr:MFS transporter [Gammaproteobacteria bacterium]
MPILLLIVFIDLLGFGLIVPLLPFYGELMGASPAMITSVIAVYSLTQLIATPFWGRLSDAYGRRPILMISMLGAVIGYVMLAMAESLWMLFVARALGGLMAGNISAAFAYVTDISSEKDRARSLGLIGAAFGLGFTLGPALGGLLAGNDPDSARVLLPAIVAAVLSLVAFLGAWWFLDESLPSEQRKPFIGRNLDVSMPFRGLLTRVDLGSLVAAALLLSAATAMMQAIFPIWASHELGYGPQTVGMAFFLLGVLAVISQAVLIGPLAKLFGAKRVALAGAISCSLGMIVLGISATHVGVVLALLLVGAGFGLFTPSVTTMVSLRAGPGERGAVMGSYQAAGSVGRIIGPAVAGVLFSHVGSPAPFVLGALLGLPALWLIVQGAKSGVSELEQTA